MIKLNDEGFLAQITRNVFPGSEDFYVERGFLNIPEPPSSDYQWRDGEWVHRPKPEKPTEFHVWDPSTYSWIQDRTLAENAVRLKRARLLAASDWTQLPDVPLETKAAWATYRQWLRDITDQAGFPFDVVWPVAP